MSHPFPTEAFVEIVRDAARPVRHAFERGVTATRKSDGTVVTAVDREVDAFLRDALVRLLPNAGWLSEETPDDLTRLEQPLVWVVDPIDGTGQLVRRIPELCVSVALVHGRKPVAAAVINPITGEEGVWVAGAPPAFRGLTARTAPPSLAQAEAIVSRSESESGDLRGLEGIVATMTPVGSIAYKLLRVASGSDALTFSMRSKSEWDVCAGIGLVRAAGRIYLPMVGRSVTFNRRTPTVSAGVAGPISLARELRARLRARLTETRP